MPYVMNNLEDEDEKKEQQPAPLLGGTSPTSLPAPGAGGVGGAQAQPQRNQAQKGTGFVGLQQWLDAGKGRDKAVSEKGATALKNEQTSFDAASGDAEKGLSGQNVLSVSDGVGAQLDREAGITPLSPTSTPTLRPMEQPSAPPAPAPVRPQISPPTAPTGGIAGALAPGAVRMIGPPPQGPTPAPAAPVRSAPTIAPPPNAPAGPTLEQVINQSYSGPDTIDYKPGQDLTDLALLSNTGTIADVTGREANERGEYSKYSGLRALDDALYGADAASVGAAGTNKKSGQDFAKATDTKVADFEKRVGERKDRMKEASESTAAALRKIGGDRATALAAEAEAENARANDESHAIDMVRDPTTGQMVPVPKGQVLGEWEGSAAGTATAGNMATDADRKRFAALEKLLGFNAPDASGDPYVAGRRTTQTAPGEVAVGPSKSVQEQYKMFLQLARRGKETGMPNALRQFQRLVGADTFRQLEQMHGSLSDNLTDEELNQMYGLGG